MTDSEPDLAELWRHAAVVMPDGWRLDALRCASTGLEPDQRSDDWTAIAVGPEGEERSATAATPTAAIETVATSAGLGPM